MRDREGHRKEKKEKTDWDVSRRHERERGGCSCERGNYTAHETEEGEFSSLPRVGEEKRKGEKGLNRAGEERVHEGGGRVQT